MPGAWGPGGTTQTWVPGTISKCGGEERELGWGRGAKESVAPGCRGQRTGGPGGPAGGRGGPGVTGDISVSAAAGDWQTAAPGRNLETRRCMRA